jgi:hypothetical protein
LKFLRFLRTLRNGCKKQQSGHHLVYLIISLINLFTPEKLVYSVFNTLHVSYHVPAYDNHVFLCDPFALKIGLIELMNP